LLPHKIFVQQRQQQQDATSSSKTAACFGILAAHLLRLAAHLRHNSAITAHFEGKNSGGGVKFSRRRRRRHNPQMTGTTPVVGWH